MKISHRKVGSVTIHYVKKKIKAINELLSDSKSPKQMGSLLSDLSKNHRQTLLKTDQIGLGHCLRVFNPNDIPRFTAFISHLVMGFSWHAQLHANRWLNIGRESIKAM